MTTTGNALEQACESITALLKGRVLARAQAEDGAVVLYCEDGAKVCLSLGLSVSGQAPVRLPHPLAALLEQAQAEADAQKLAEQPASSADAPPADKPPAQRVAISGIDATRVGFAQSASGMQWERIVALPPFQEYVRACGFPPDDGMNADEWAAMFVMQQARSGVPEAKFFADYARWFEQSGRWPGELPTGGMQP